MVKGNWQARVEKAQRKKDEKRKLKESKEAGLIVEPAELLAKLLQTHPDADIYLAAADPSARPLCRARFFFDACSNRRCKWSHALSIAGASTNVPHALGRGGDPAAAAAAAQVEPLELDRDLVHRLWPAPGAVGRPVPGSMGPWWGALPDPIVGEALLSCVAGDRRGGGGTVGALAAACRGLRLSCLRSPAVAAAKRARLPEFHAARARRLRAQASRLRFAVVAAEAQGGGGWTGAPLLAHDAAHIEVWRAFERRAAWQESGGAGAKAAAAAAAAAAGGGGGGKSGDYGNGGGGGSGGDDPVTSGGGRHDGPAAKGGSKSKWSLTAALLGSGSGMSSGGGGGGGGAGPAALRAVFGHAADPELGALCTTCSAVRAVARADGEYRSRKRDGLLRLKLTAQKGKKSKKKAKSPGGKKDGFSRGQ